MFEYLLLSILVTHVAWAKPLQQLGELTPHVFIVTPQAQLQLDSLAHGTPVIQHLSPYTRFVSPHEETIVYIPTSAAGSRSVASIVPKYQFDDVLARSAASDITARQDSQSSWIQSACNNIPPLPNINEIQNPVQIPPISVPQPPLPTIQWPSLSESVNGFNPAAIAGGSTSNKVDTSTPKPEGKSPLGSSAPASINSKLPILSNIKHIEYDFPVTPILVNEPRHQHYAAIIAPSPAQIVDYVHTPVFLSPSIPTIKGRSLKEPLIAIPLPEAPKPESLPLAVDFLPEIKQEEKKKDLDLEKIKENESIQLIKEGETLDQTQQIEAAKLLPQPEQQPKTEADLKPTAATKLESELPEKSA